MGAAPNMTIQNSTDATSGQPIGERVRVRMAELEQALAELGEGAGPQRQAIEAALATINSLATGDLEHPSDVIAQDFNTWLERNKYLTEENADKNPR